MSTLLALDGVSVNYGAVAALKNITLEVPEGSIVSLIGANGAGKSTTLKAIMGLAYVRCGSISFEGETITNLKTHSVVHHRIALCPEGRRIFLNLSVEENLRIGGLVTKNKGLREAIMDEIFMLFPRIKERLKQSGGTLSGGEQQMLAISRAMMQNPRLMLLDEPSLGLAPNLVDEIFEKIKFLNGEGKTILLVEQNAYHAIRCADYAHVLEQGEIVLSGTGAELEANPRVKEAYLGG
jgi:branched-chain amino acid transport system ATP-binding protein